MTDYPHTCSFCGTPYRVHAEGTTHYPVTEAQDAVLAGRTDSAESVLVVNDKLQESLDYLSELAKSSALTKQESLILEYSTATITTALAEKDERVEQLIAERDLAIAHDTQPYPTAWAYKQACEALATERKATMFADELLRLWSRDQHHGYMFDETMRDYQAAREAAKGEKP